MRILLVSPANVAHTMKWAAGLADRGIKVGVFTLAECDRKFYQEHNVKLFIFGLNKSVYKEACGSLKKLRYLTYVHSLKKVIKEFNPDIVHAHYASGNGLLGALSGFHPYIVSVWGSDVYEFPQKSWIHKEILKFNLKHADRILSTSHVMAQETNRYTNKKIEITPFGVDMAVFKPMKPTISLFKNDDIVVGTIKTLEEKYGVEYLIRAFAKVKLKLNDDHLKLLIVGDGSLRKKLEALALNLGISESTLFTGKIPWMQVPMYDNLLSISVSVSTVDSESFGVAVIEASACEKPVVVSDVGGLPEVVNDGVTGIIVPKCSIDKTAEAIEKLIVEEDMRLRMGRAGRMRVNKKYNWNDNLTQMINIYEESLR